uniref:Uncharacterized protein n=1 Tax=Manihot esculenta TaxID=3983 RepID=A0A2C9USN8_MANES
MLYLISGSCDILLQNSSKIQGSYIFWQHNLYKN